MDQETNSKDISNIMDGIINTHTTMTTNTSTTVPTDEQVVEPIKVKKKRGRKPKDKSAASDVNKEKKVPKKRGRKPKDTYVVLNNNYTLPVKSFVENIILHLPINNLETEKSDNEIFPLQNESEQNSYKIETGNLMDGSNLITDTSDPIPYDPYNDMNMDISDSCIENICWWDDQQFKNNRWGIPSKFVNDSFHIYGCFCSPNCAAAYLFNMYKDTDDIWNKYSLLNFMYNSIYGTNISVKLAPSKLILKKYGGDLSIKEYRSSFNNKHNNYYINIPSTIIYNINVENINNNSSEDNTDNSELRLYRRGPIIDYKQTLDSSMNLNIS
jgi:hypothetical protein